MVAMLLNTQLCTFNFVNIVEAAAEITLLYSFGVFLTLTVFL